MLESKASGRIINWMRISITHDKCMFCPNRLSALIETVIFKEEFNKFYHDTAATHCPYHQNLIESIRLIIYYKERLISAVNAVQIGVIIDQWIELLCNTRNFI